MQVRQLCLTLRDTNEAQTGVWPSRRVRTRCVVLGAVVLGAGIGRETLAGNRCLKEKSDCVLLFNQI